MHWDSIHPKCVTLCNVWHSTLQDILTELSNVLLVGELHSVCNVLIFAC